MASEEQMHAAVAPEVFERGCGVFGRFVAVADQRIDAAGGEVILHPRRAHVVFDDLAHAGDEDVVASMRVGGIAQRFEGFAETMRPERRDGDRGLVRDG